MAHSATVTDAPLKMACLCGTRLHSLQEIEEHAANLWQYEVREMQDIALAILRGLDRRRVNGALRNGH